MSDLTGYWPKWIEDAGIAIKKGMQKTVAAVNTMISKVKSTVSKFDFEDIANKSARTVKAAYTSVEASAGVGLGLYAEANICDYVGVCFGINYNLLEIKLDDGSFSLEQSYFNGLGASMLFADILQDTNDSGSRKLVFSSPIDDFTPNEYNRNWTIFAAGAYPICRRIYI